MTGTCRRAEEDTRKAGPVGCVVACFAGSVEVSNRLVGFSGQGQPGSKNRAGRDLLAIQKTLLVDDTVLVSWLYITGKVDLPAED